MSSDDSPGMNDNHDAGTGEHEVVETPVADPLLTDSPGTDSPDTGSPDTGSPDTGSPDTGAPTVVKTATRQQSKAVGKSIREWGLVVVIAIAAAVLMKLFVVQQFYVSGESMDYTLHNFDRVLVNKLSYDLHDPNRGDVVVLEEEQGLTQRDLIKRVIGLPGETIEMRDCVVYIDGKVLVEPYLDPDVVTPGNCGTNFSSLVVLEDHVFVMGDNRPGSGDSRGTLGQVDYGQIVGRAFVVIWPKSHWQWL